MTTINNTELEQVFSDMAYAHLRDKSNSLLDYLLGFQMLKSEKDGKRAVGVFGFEIDDDIYYAPTFFLNGEIRGLDSLYALKSDLFMPLTDDWVGELVNKADINIGDPDKRSRRERGVREPSYQQLKVVPGGANVKLGEAMSTLPSDHISVVSLPEAVRGLGKNAQAGFVADLRKNAALRQAVENYYSILDFAPTPEQEKVAAEEKPLLIIGQVSDEGVEQLTDEQRKDVLAGGVAVVDPRPETDRAQLIRTQTTQCLTTPTDPGMYELLMADGSIEPCLVLTTGQRRNRLLVWGTKSKKWCVCDAQAVSAVRKLDKGLREWALDATLPSACRGEKIYTFTNLDGQGSIPYRVIARTDGLDGSTVLTVRPVHDLYWETNNTRSYPQPMDDRDPQYRNSRTEDVNNVRQVIVTPSKTSVPLYFKDKLVISDRHFRAQLLPYTQGDWCGDSQHLFQGSDFGDYNTLWSQMDKVAQTLEAWRRNGEYHFKTAGDIHSSGRLGAYRFLVGSCGLSKEAADELVDELTTDTSRYWVKAAARLEFPQLREPTSGGEMSAYHDTNYDDEQVETAQTEDNRAVYEYESPFAGGDEGSGTTLERIQAAVQTGDKDVFDVTALASLIKSYVPTTLVDRYIPSITVGMDRIGRILFLIYWHYGEFAERYGDDETGDLIDNLSSVFQQLGDMVISLKQRTLAGDPEHYGLGISSDTETDHG